VGSNLEKGGGLLRMPATQQLLRKTQGTKYQNIYEQDQDQHTAAVKHKLLYDRDPEYRKLFTED
jgi:hypothetical protein